MLYTLNSELTLQDVQGHTATIIISVNSTK